MRSICVFCGSKPGSRAGYAAAAERLADELVRRDARLVYGGSKMGLMGTIATAVLQRRGEVVGVIPRLLMKTEVVHPELSELHVVSSMHERKAKMAELSDGFVSLPGGLGTWEETLEILTWLQLGIHDKPCGLLNVEGYFDPIIQLFAHGREEGFLRGEPESLLLVETDPTVLLDRMEAREPTEHTSSWMSLQQA